MVQNDDKRDFYAAKQVLSTRLKNLEAAGRKLAAAITETDGHLAAYVARPIDFYKPADPKAKLEVNEQVKMEHLFGKDAREAAAKMIQAFKYEEGQHKNASLRLPGFIVASNTTMAAIHDLNEAKAAIEEVIQSEKYFGGSEKFRARGRKDSEGKVIEEFKHLHLLQIYREIALIETRPQKIAFSWQANGADTRPRTQQWVLDQIEEDRKNPPASRSTADWNRQLDREVQAIQQLPKGEELVYRRRKAPSPAINLWTKDTARPTEFERPALPLFIPGKPGDPDWAPVYDVMADLDMRQRRSMRSDASIENEPYIDRLDLYRRRPERRNADVPNGEGSMKRRKGGLVVTFSIPGDEGPDSVSVTLDPDKSAVNLAKLFMGGTDKFRGQSDEGSVALTQESGTFLFAEIRSKAERRSVKGIWRFADAKKAFLAAF